MNRSALALLLLFPLPAVAELPAPVRRWVEGQAALKSVEAEFAQVRTLKQVRQPLTSAGKLWFVAPGNFRWEVTAPSPMMVVQKEGEPLLLVDLAKKRGKRVSREEAARGSSMEAAGFMQLGFPRDAAAFEAAFVVLEVTTDQKQRLTQVALRPREAKAAGAVPKIVLQMEAASGDLMAFNFQFQDGSRMDTTIRNARKNEAVPAAVFQPDLTEIKVKD